MEPAGPKADPMSLRPKYDAVANFPAVKRIAVKVAHTQTSLQLMRASGTILKIEAKNRVTMTK